MAKIVQFNTTSLPSPNSELFLLSSQIPLPISLQDRLRKAIDRFQRLVLLQPSVANFLLEWIERFFDRHGV